MTGIEIGLIVQAALVLGGFILRGHAPRLWPFFAPIFGAASQASAPAPQIAPQGAPQFPPQEPPASGAGSRVPAPSSPPHNLLAALRRLPEPSAEEDLELSLDRYVREKQTPRRIASLLSQAQRETSRTLTPTVAEPSKN
jgi:hypothetical protein